MFDPDAEPLRLRGSKRKDDPAGSLTTVLRFGSALCGGLAAGALIFGAGLMLTNPNPSFLLGAVGVAATLGLSAVQLSLVADQRHTREYLAAIYRLLRDRQR